MAFNGFVDYINYPERVSLSFPIASFSTSINGKVETVYLWYNEKSGNLNLSDITGWSYKTINLKNIIADIKDLINDNVLNYYKTYEFLIKSSIIDLADGFMNVDDIDSFIEPFVKRTLTGMYRRDQTYLEKIMVSSKIKSE